MHTTGVLEGWTRNDYKEEYHCVLLTLSNGLEAHLLVGERSSKDKQYHNLEDRIAVPDATLDGSLDWPHLNWGHTGCNRSMYFVKGIFFCRLTHSESKLQMQSKVDSCRCHTDKQNGSRDPGLITCLQICNCSNSLMYVYFIHGLPRF